MFRRIHRALPLLILPLASGVQQGAAQPRSSAAAEAELHRHHAAVGQLLVTIEQAHSLLYEQLLAEPGAAEARVDGEFFDRILSYVANRESPAVPTPNLSRVAPRAVAIFQRAYDLQRRIYDIYSNEDLSNRPAAVEQAIDEYLTQPTLALSSSPKSMEIMDQQHGSMAFRQQYPKTAGLYWAFRWLQLGGTEPLMVFRTPQERHEGVEATTARFGEMLQEPPSGFPSHMPMAPTVAPEMVTRHPRAAAIFDNLNMMHDVIADILVDPSVGDRTRAIDAVIDLFIDPAYLRITDIDWIRMSLRHGIYAQGGPAIGRIERPERNDSHHHGAEGGSTRMRPPGM